MVSELIGETCKILLISVTVNKVDLLKKLFQNSTKYDGCP